MQNHSLLSVGINSDIYHFIYKVSQQCHCSFEETLREYIETGLKIYSLEELKNINYISSRDNNIIVSCNIPKDLILLIENITLKSLENNPFSATKSKIVYNCIYLTMTIPTADCIF